MTDRTLRRYRFGVRSAWDWADLGCGDQRPHNWQLADPKDRPTNDALTTREDIVARVMLVNELDQVTTGAPTAG